MKKISIFILSIFMIGFCGLVSHAISDLYVPECFNLKDYDMVVSVECSCDEDIPEEDKVLAYVYTIYLASLNSKEVKKFSNELKYLVICDWDSMYTKDEEAEAMKKIFEEKDLFGKIKDRHLDSADFDNARLCFKDFLRYVVQKSEDWAVANVLLSDWYKKLNEMTYDKDFEYFKRAFEGMNIHGSVLPRLDAKKKLCELYKHVFIPCCYREEENDKLLFFSRECKNGLKDVYKVLGYMYLVRSFVEFEKKKIENEIGKLKEEYEKKLQRLVNFEEGLKCLALRSSSENGFTMKNKVSFCQTTNPNFKIDCEEFFIKESDMNIFSDFLEYVGDYKRNVEEKDLDETVKYTMKFLEDMVKNSQDREFAAKVFGVETKRKELDSAEFSKFKEAVMNIEIGDFSLITFCDGGPLNESLDFFKWLRALC